MEKPVASTTTSKAEARVEHPPHPKNYWVHQTFAALKYPNYRLWFIGQLVSLVGTWMQSTAQGFLIYQLTQSPAFLGYVSFVAGVPSWLLTLYGGVISDRMPRRTLLIITQTSMMVLAFILAILTFTKLVQPWHVLILAFFLGVSNAFDAPTRLAFVLEMVDREDLTNAIALNATMFNSATAVGPAVAGLTYAALGPAWCFTLNGISFIAVIIALLRMKLKPWIAPVRNGSALADLKVGLKYVVNHPTIRVLILGLGVMSLFGMGFVTLIPAWSVEILHGDVTTNGLLISSRGIGALIGALMIASLGRFVWKGRLLTLGSFIFPLTLALFAFERWLPLSLLTISVVGWSWIIFVNLTNALVQTSASDELRGRVMGFYTLVFFGLLPISSLLAGQAASVIGEQKTVLISAGILLAYSTIAYLFIPKIRKLF
ncbi:MAG: MFS transporter [Omnitrophica WOR_2 bacterium]